MKVEKKSIYNALSYLVDVFEGNYLDHAKHVAYTSLLIGKEAGIEEECLERLYSIALIHDIGAGSVYGLKNHCIAGEEIIEKIGYGDREKAIMLYHHELKDGSGPFGISGEDIPVESQIIHIANLLDNHLKLWADSSLKTQQKLLSYVETKRGLFDDALIEATKSVGQSGYYLHDYLSKDLDQVLAKHSASLKEHYLNYDEVEKLSRAFSDVIDLRNPFTAEHSNGIAEKVKCVVEGLGIEEDVRNKAYIAALLHDIGKVFVSNDILDKNGPLEPWERYEINKHTYYTRWVLERIDGFEEITEWAANHHEKLDGSGYPYGLDASELDDLSRIMAIIDIYQALTEPRPYRNSMGDDRAWKIIGDMVDHGKLDAAYRDKIKDLLID